MKFNRRAKLTKKCPRCGNRCLINQTKCEECDLLFSRLEFCSNKAAKKQLLRFDRDYIIYTKDLPKDVKWWKLILLASFTGLFGGHYYYVGKFIKGFLMSLMMMYSILCTVFNPQISAMAVANSAIESLIYAPMGCFVLAWIVSLVYVLSRKFKVPVIVDIPSVVQEDMKAKKADFAKTKAELEDENKKAKEGKVVKDKTKRHPEPASRDSSTTLRMTAGRSVEGSTDKKKGKRYK